MTTTVALPVEAIALVYDVSIETMNVALARAQRDGLVEVDSRGRWTATERGRRVRRDLLLTLDVDEIDTEKR